MSIDLDQISELRVYMQKIMRSFVSNSMQTPCGVKVSTSFAHVLLTLHKMEDVLVNQQILAKELGLNKSSIARICSDLEKQDFIKIEMNLDDKRNNSLLLTAKGLKLATRLKDQGDQYFFSILKKIPKNKIKLLLSSLEVLTDALEQDLLQGQKK